jgi:hypothetical protein
MRPATAVSQASRCYSEAEVYRMAIMVHFSKRDDRKLTMPRADEGFPDPSGFAFHGDVVTGKLSVQEAFALEAARLSQTTPRGVRAPPKTTIPFSSSISGSNDLEAPAKHRWKQPRPLTERDGERLRRSRS